jgi:hypothetical protein
MFDEISKVAEVPLAKSQKLKANSYKKYELWF